MFKTILRLLLLPFRMFRRFWRWYKSCYAGKSWIAKTFIALISFVVFVFSYAAAVQFNFLWLFGDSPSISTIMNPPANAASEVYSADGVLLHKFYNENRAPVAYEDINPVFFEALISTEDERFYQHHGIDFMGLLAAAKDALAGHPRGASTITQQLVKNMHRMRSRSSGLLGHIPGVRMIIMKSKEMIIASEIELLYSKEEILTMYANTVDFGSNAYGIKTAAKTYFNTDPSKLKLQEAAVLVGILKATNAYNPRVNPENAKRRRNTVIDNMVNQGYVSKAKAETLKETEIKLKYTPENPKDGTALYFRQAVLSEIHDIMPGLDPDVDGLKIYTTLDSRMQKYAEEAVRSHMRSLQSDFLDNWGGQDPWVDDNYNTIKNFLNDKIKQTDAYKVLAASYPDNPEIVREKLNEKHRVRLFTYDGKGYRDVEMSSMDSLRYMLRFMHTGFVAMEPTTGFVKAYVGDVDFYTWEHDNVRATHQPGSTFKLFVYATAIKNGLTPNDTRKDEQIVIRGAGKSGGDWRPQNANGKFTNAPMSLRTAFAHSVNSIAVRLGKEFGISNVIRTAHDMGITSELQNIPSLPLGSSDVSPYELVSAYCTVANYGTHVEPTCIERIEDADGRIIYTANTKSYVALSEREAFYMQSLLAAGVKEGTSQGMKNYIGDLYAENRVSVGGKTGTTNNHTDAWFVGVTPNLVAGAWVGGQYRQIHFRSGALGQGSRAAMPIVGKFFDKVLHSNKLGRRYCIIYHTPSGTDASAIRGDRNDDGPKHDSTETDSIDYIATEPEPNPYPEQTEQTTTNDNINSGGRNERSDKNKVVPKPSDKDNLFD